MSQWPKSQETCLMVWERDSMEAIVLLKLSPRHPGLMDSRKGKALDIYGEMRWWVSSSKSWWPCKWGTQCSGHHNLWLLFTSSVQFGAWFRAVFPKVGNNIPRELYQGSIHSHQCKCGAFCLSKEVLQGEHCDLFTFPKKIAIDQKSLGTFVLGYCFYKPQASFSSLQQILNILFFVWGEVLGRRAGLGHIWLF